MNFVTMNSRSKLKCYSAVCSNREKKRRDKTELLRLILTERTMRCEKFSYLERVHALPVLVQVVHEIHDDDVKKQRISAEQSFVRKFCAKKVGCLSNETHVLHFFICVLREKSMCFVELHKMFTTTTQRIRRTRKG